MNLDGFIQVGKSVYFVSDPHFGHNKEFLFQSRGFKSIEEHDAALVDRWNKTVSSDATVFCLGDFLFGMDGERRIEEFFDKLSFKYLYLMRGNHGAGWKQVLKECYNNCTNFDSNFVLFKVYGKKIVRLIPNYFEILVSGQPIVLCHYPIVSWNQCAAGSWHLFGHCHNNLIGFKGKALDVGIEAFGGPVSFEFIKNIMDKKEIEKFPGDHHS